MTTWKATIRPLVVDETADNNEPTAADMEAARQNYLHMEPLLRAYVDALRRRFPDGTEDEDRPILN